MSSLTSRRIIESRNLDTDVSDDYAEEIQDAIHMGIQLSCHSRRGGDYETCVTRFTDPRTAEQRFAVEVWVPGTRWISDFEAETVATAYQTREDNCLGL